MYLIISMCLVQMFTALNNVLIAPIFPIISDKFGWTSSNEDWFLGIAQNIPLVGNALANFLGLLTKDMKPSRVIFITKLCYILGIGLILIKNTYVLIVGRFFCGLAIGFQFPPAVSTLY